MSFVAILIGVALLVASILLVAEPLFRKKRSRASARKESGNASRGSYQQTLLAIRDLDFDHQMGVLTDTDYEQQRASLMSEAAAAYENKTADADDIEQLIEAAVRQRRRNAKIAHKQCANCGADLDQANNFCADCGYVTSGACPQCNRPVKQGDHFCTSCGAHLVIVEGVVG